MHLRIMFLLAVFVLTCMSLTAQRPEEDLRPTYNWEGTVRHEAAYSGKFGRHKWVGEFRVLLVEKQDFKSSRLTGIELDYKFTADESKNGYRSSSEYDVFGTSSGKLRGNTLTRESHTRLKGDGEWGTGQEIPVSRGGTVSSRYNYCGAGEEDQPGSYNIFINFAPDGWTLEEWVAPFEGIRISGPSYNSYLRYHSLSETRGQHIYYAGAHVSVCGRLDRRDQETVRGSVSFERVWSDEDAGNPEKISISWDLRRTKKRATREVSTPEPGGNPTGNSAGTLPADLDITVAGSTVPLPVGDQRGFTLTVTNNGPGPAPGTVLTGIFPAGMKLFSVTPSQGRCSGTSTITCTLGTIAKDASAKVVIGIGPKVAGVFINRVKVASSVPDPDISNNNDTFTIRGRRVGDVP